MRTTALESMTRLADMRSQRPLDFPGPFRPQLDNFFCGDNSALLQLLQRQAQQPDGWHYLHGQASCGKTHLLWGLQTAALEHGWQALYVQIGDASTLPVLQQLQGQDLLLLDNAEALSAAHSWQQALFDAMQRAQQQQLAVVMAGRTPLAAMTGLLPDLRSRLATMSQHRVQALPDAQRAEFVQAYLARHNIPIATDVLAYLLSRVVREQAQLLRLLQQLCERVLISGQGPTRPLLRELMSPTPDQ